MMVIARRLELWEDGVHWEREYLTEEGDFDRDVLFAELFQDEGEAKSRVTILCGQGGYPYPVMREEVSDEIAERVTRHRLRRYAAIFFLLPLETPVCVVADRYEEDGYYEEAAFLRGDLGVEKEFSR